MSFHLLKAVLVLATLCGRLSAQEQPEWLARAQPAVVMIENRGFGGGSGTLVAADLVLTCDHLFRNDRTGGAEIGRVVVSLANGEGSEAEVLAQDPVWDLALLRLKHAPQGAQPASLARRVPVPGERVISCGYGGRGAMRANVGQVQGYGYDKQRATGAADTLIISGSARSGDSGGPMFNERGELCGVLWGTSGTEVVGTQCGRCWQFGGAYLGPGGSCPRPAAPSRPSVPSSITTQPPAVLPAPASDELAKLRAELADLRGKLAALEKAPGPPGPMGPAGPKGDSGRDGAAAEADLDRVARLVKEKLAGSIRIRVEPVASR